MTVDETLHLYAQVARPIIRDVYNAESCVASTAITIAVLKCFGISAEPFPCTLELFNRAFADRVRAQGRMPNDEEAAEWLKDGKAWSVGIGVGYSAISEGIGGHLVAIADNQYLVDASFDQASRPHKDMILPGVMVQRVSQEFLQRQQQFVFTTDTGVLGIYEAQLENKKWQASPNWTDERAHAICVSRILRAHKAASRAECG